MKASVISLLKEAEQKMSGYSALLHYRYQNLSVKAEPAALLPIMVEVDGETLPLEKTAQAGNPTDREDQFVILPLQKEWLYPVLKGLKEAHPEYKIELMDLDQEEDVDNDDELAKYILATMPVMDDARHDVLMEAVSLLSDGCKVQLDAVLTKYTAQAVGRLVGAPAEDIDEAKDEFQKLHDSYEDLCKQFRADKEKEIEDAYASYQEAKAAMEAKIQEQEAALNEQAGQQMKWNPDDDD